MLKSNIFQKFIEYFDKSPIEVAKELCYNNDNIFLLELDINDINKLASKNPELYSILRSCGHHRDSRTLIEYAQDLICSWLIEDYIISELKNNNLAIELSGEDRERKILKSRKISTNSDYFISFNGKKAYIELANDFTGFWHRTGKYDLRDSKFNHLKEMAKLADKSLILGIDFKNHLFFLIDVCSPEIEVKSIPYHFIYRKPAFSISIPKTILKKYSTPSIIEAIKTELS